MIAASPTTIDGPGALLRSRAARITLLIASQALLVACGDYGGGAGGTGSGAVAGTSGGSGGSSSGTTQEDASIQAFSQSVHPLVSQYCADCHGGLGPGSPSIADPDPALAYAATINNQKVDLANPPASRLVARLALDLHFCWDNCNDDAAAMAAAVAQWANLIGFDSNNTVLPDAIRSSDAMMSDGEEIDPASSRYSTDRIALWEFREGSGDTAFDTSGVDPAIDLELSGDVTWMSNFGLAFENGLAIGERNTSEKLYDRIADPVTGSQAYSVELWSRAANISQEDAILAAYHGGSGSRNWELRQQLYSYEYRHRVASGNSPSLTTDNDRRLLQAVLQHVVITYDQYRGRRIYVNGVWTGDEDPNPAERLYSWNDGFQVVFGDARNGNRDWEGRIRYAAVYDSVMPDDAILQNYLAGVGQKRIVRFDTSALAGAGSYIEFEISEFDEFSYLLCNPTFRGVNPNGTRVAGLRIAVNGVIPVAGQAFTSVDSAAFTQPARLSDQCSIIRKDQGADLDVFSIDFEVLEGFEHVETVNYPAPGIDASVDDPMPEMGFRDSARVNATMASITGVESTAVRTVYDEISEALPSTPDMRSFVASNQVNISKLALEYCDNLVEDNALRTAFFGPFPFDQAPAAALDAAGRTQIIDALYANAIGTNLTSQPDYADVGVNPGVASVLDQLAVDLINSCDAEDPCDPVRTRSIVKSMCTAVLASGAALMQ